MDFKSFIAEFNMRDHDMYWKCRINLDGEYFDCVWCGYNDENWWDNVSKACDTIEVKGNKGTIKKFKINFKTDDVTVVD